MYEVIDHTAISLAEAFSHKLQRLTGISNFLIAKIIAAVGTISPSVGITLVHLSVLKPDEHENPLSPTYMLGIMIIFTIWDFFYTYRIFTFDEDKVWANLKKGLSNGERFDYFHRRNSVFITAIIGLGLGALQAGIDNNIFFVTLMIDFPLIWISYIFLACTPLPPAEENESIANAEPAPAKM